MCAEVVADMERERSCCCNEERSRREGPGIVREESAEERRAELPLSRLVEEEEAARPAWFMRATSSCRGYGLDGGAEVPE